MARFTNIASGMLPATLDAGHGIINRIFALLFPRWTTSQANRRIFMWNPVDMLAGRVFGLLENDVWQKPSVRHHTVFVDSIFSRDLLAASDFPVEKIVVSGSPVLDNVVRAMRNEDHADRIARSLGIEARAGFVLVNIEPAAEHHYCDWQKHWTNIDAVMQAVTRLKEPIVLSLHPLCDPAKYEFLQDKFGVRISRDFKIHELYPYCRFCVTFPCSTNRLSALFGRKIIVYDFFGIVASGSQFRPMYLLPNAEFANDADSLTALIERTAQQVQQAAPTVAHGEIVSTACSVILSHTMRIIEAKPQGNPHCRCR